MITPDAAQANIDERKRRYRQVQEALIPQNNDDAILPAILQIDGQIHNEEVYHLRKLAGHVPPNGLVVEIGCYKGKSSASIASGLPENARMVCIDPWTRQAPLLTQHTSDYHTPETLLAWQRNTQRWKNNITQIIGFPLDVVKWWNAPIDMLFVDCCKHYEEILPIWQAWFPFCRNIVASHDYNTNAATEFHYPGVIRALQEVAFPHTNNHEHVHFTWSGKIK